MYYKADSTLKALTLIAIFIVNHKTMTHKILLPLAFLFVLSGISYAQQFRGPDKSAMDMAYFPDHYAHDRKE